MRFLLVGIMLMACGKNGHLSQLGEGAELLGKKIGSFVETVGRSPRIIGNKLLGTSEDTNENVDSNKKEIDDINARMMMLFSDVYTIIEDLEDKVDSNNTVIVNSLQDQYDILYSQIVAGDDNSSLYREISILQRKVFRIRRDIVRINRRLDYHRTLLRGLYRRIGSLEDNQDNLQQLIATNQADILALENSQGVSKIIDPCGDYPGYFDEVIIQLQDGTLLAYFESRGKRFLTVLVDGYYRTTDKDKCYFQVSNGEVLSNIRQ